MCEVKFMKKTYNTEQVLDEIKNGITAEQLLLRAGVNIENNLDKGFELIQNAFEKIQKVYPDANFNIDGEGSVTVYLGNAISKDEISKRGYGETYSVNSDLIGYENSDLLHTLYLSEI